MNQRINQSIKHLFNVWIKNWQVTSLVYLKYPTKTDNEKKLKQWPWLWPCSDLDCDLVVSTIISVVNDTFNSYRWYWYFLTKVSSIPISILSQKYRRYVYDTFGDISWHCRLLKPIPIASFLDTSWWLKTIFVMTVKHNKRELIRLLALLGYKRHPVHVLYTRPPCCATPMRVRLLADETDIGAMPS